MRDDHAAGTQAGVDSAAPFRFVDALGPEKVVQIYEPRISLKAVVVIDNVACGPAIGGVRMAPDVSVEECVRLARAMTLKNAAAGLAHGGGKSVIFGDPRMSAREKELTIRAFARAIRDLLDYIPGPDMGTDECCMAWTKDEIGRARRPAAGARRHPARRHRSDGFRALCRRGCRERLLQSGAVRRAGRRAGFRCRREACRPILG